MANCKWDLNIKKLTAWKKANPDANTIPNGALNTWVRVKTGKDKSNGKYVTISEEKRASLEPLVKGLQCNGWNH